MNINGYILAVLGLFTTVVGVYIAASFTLAQKQLLAATRLQAYLMHWWRWSIDNGAYVVFVLGEMWDKEEQELFRRGALAQEHTDLRNAKKKMCLEIEQKLKDPEFIGDEMITILQQAIARIAEVNEDRILDELRVSRQNFLTGQTFITDDEATCLGVGVASVTVSFKMEVLDLIDGIIAMALRAAKAKDLFDPKAFVTDSGKLVWKTTTVGKSFHVLLRSSQHFTNSTVLKLTWMNIVQGSRITRR